MSHILPKCKITVLKKTVNQDLIDGYLDDSHSGHSTCECYQEGQEFVIDPSSFPEEFSSCCP